MVAELDPGSCLSLKTLGVGGSSVTYTLIFLYAIRSGYEDDKSGAVISDEASDPTAICPFAGGWRTTFPIPGGRRGLGRVLYDLRTQVPQEELLGKGNCQLQDPTIGTEIIP